MVAFVDIADVAAPERLHHGCDLPGLGRRHEQVHVVRHQDIRVDFATFAHRDLAQVAQVAFIVDLGEEARPAIVAALDDMLCDARKVKAWLA